MTDLIKLYDMAVLSEASYVLFHKVSDLSKNETVKEALQDGGFSATQAADFVANWQVVSHQQNTINAFSATLFKNKHTGEYVYVPRGTEGLVSWDFISADMGDIVTDGLASKQIVDMFNDWMRIITPQNQTYQAAKLDFGGTETALLQAERVLLLGTVAGPYERSLRDRTDIIIDDPGGTVLKIELKSSADVYGNSARATGLGIFNSYPPPLSVAGHSLGGHLAVAFTRLFANTGASAYTINGAGYPTGYLPGLGGNAENNIRNLFYSLNGTNSFNSSIIQNFYGSAAPEIVTMNNPLGLMQQGGHEEVYIESSSAGNAFGHGASQMTDALAVYDLFIRLDKRYQTGTAMSVLGELEAIFKAISPEADYTFESLVNTLNKLLVSSSSAPIAKNNREALYSNINSIRKAIDKIPVSAVITVDPLPIYPASTIINMAKGIDLNTNDSLAYRYALKELNPFAIRGLDYSNANKNGELDLLNLTNGKGDLLSAGSGKDQLYGSNLNDVLVYANNYQSVAERWVAA